MVIEMDVLFFAVSLLASTVGAISGIGGGVLIKPLLDSFQVLSVGTISFLSGCTVLSMSVVSVLRAKAGSKGGGSLLNIRISTPLAIGAAAGGIVGKTAFAMISSHFGNDDQVGAIQALCLIFITVGTMLYTVCSNKVKTRNMKNIAGCLVIGLLLGIMSSFLGIGGGPINLVVLYYFFSMDTKTAAQNSLYIIMFSQLTSLINTLATHTVPDFEILLLVLMAAGGVLGGIAGGRINKTIKEGTVKKLFIVLMAIIIIINIYNFIRFSFL